MKAFGFLLILTLVSACVTAQIFEGEIIYHNVYQSKIAGLSDEKFTTQ